MDTVFPEHIERMKSASIFLNGSYPQEHLAFYRQAIGGAVGQRLLVAADGGSELFARLGFAPDLIVGDFDSISAQTLALFSETEKVRFPRAKDATDGELALRTAIDRGCNDIEIYGAVDTRFETDQMLANLFLLKLAKRLSDATTAQILVRAVDHCQHIYFLKDDRLELSGKQGDFLSIVPISNEIVVSITGVVWELDQREVQLGSSWTLRNQFSASTVIVTIEGSALVIHRHTTP